MKVHFYPTDITYTVKDGKAIVQLYGRTVEGKQICVLDDNFEPYFYVIGNVEEKKLKVSKEDYKVIRVEKVTKKLNESEVEALKIIVNVPKAVPVLKDVVKEVEGVNGVYEYDILYGRRYLIDKGITPLTLTEVEGEEVAWNSRVPCIKAEKIKAEKEDVLEPKILALDIETYNPDNTMDTKKNPILMVGLYGKDFSRVITWKKFKAEEYVEFVSNEADMLQRFVELVNDYAPDFITGYFTDGFDFPYMVDRAKVNKVKLDIGLDYSELQIAGRMRKEGKITGIAHIDIYKFIRKTIAPTLKTDVYTLDAVSEELLGKKKLDVNMEELAISWDKNEKLGEYAKYNLVDCELTYGLTEKVLPNLIEFVRIIGLAPYDINRMTFSTYVEWYLMRKASESNEILQNRPSRKRESNRMGDRIKGAFVYEPKPGLYQSIMVFDYRSLYPSIIASHNISKGTLNCDCCGEPKVDTERGTFWYCQKKKGLFSTIISELILRRSEIKKEMKTSKDALLKARSNALKVLANSFYGYMGFAPARWYCIECAESTTAWARHYIHKAITTAKEAGFNVLYSDTDSVFLQLGVKTKEEALDLVKQINKDLPELMELEYEGFYPSGLFVSLKTAESGAKKKYALLDEKDNITIKGFEAVRRNWSLIAKETQRAILGIVLKEGDADKAKDYVKTVIEDLRNNRVPIEKVVIKTALSRSIEAYATIGPHVAAAKRMEATGKTLGAGSIIKYVVVKGKGKIRDKVMLPEEVSKEDYDGEYYITNQIIPGLERIFAVLGITSENLLKDSTQKSLEGF